MEVTIKTITSIDIPAKQTALQILSRDLLVISMVL